MQCKIWSYQSYHESYLIIIALSYHGLWCFVVFYILPLSNSFIVECKPIWTWGPGLVALVSQLQFTPCRCQHQAATAWNVNFRARGNFNVVLWAEMTTRWHCLLAMLAMHWWLLTWTSKHFSSVFSNICQQFLKPLHSGRLLLDQPAESLPSSVTSTFVPATAPSLHLGSPSKSMPLFSLGSKQWLAPYSPEALDKNHRASSSQWQNGISWTSGFP